MSKLEERLADQTSIASEVSLLKAELEAVRAEVGPPSPAFVK